METVQKLVDSMQSPFAGQLSDMKQLVALDMGKIRLDVAVTRSQLEAVRSHFGKLERAVSNIVSLPSGSDALLSFDCSLPTCFVCATKCVTTNLLYARQKSNSQGKYS